MVILETANKVSNCVQTEWPIYKFPNGCSRIPLCSRTTSCSVWRLLFWKRWRHTLYWCSCCSSRLDSAKIYSLLSRQRSDMSQTWRESLPAAFIGQPVLVLTGRNIRFLQNLQNSAYNSLCYKLDKDNLQSATTCYTSPHNYSSASMGFMTPMSPTMNMSPCLLNCS
jgi:hypothetical protein